MVKKLQKLKTAPTTNAPLSGSMKDSAQQIWQAGLGAFAKAQAEGSKALESLVKESTSLQRKTQAAAEEKISEATSKMTSMASDIGAKASGQWDKLENIFEDRVAKALNKLGMPSAKDVTALMGRMDALSKQVQKLSAGKTAAPKAVASTGVKVATKSPRKAAAKPAVKAVAKTATKPTAKRASSRKTAPANAAPQA